MCLGGSHTHAACERLLDEPSTRRAAQAFEKQLRLADSPSPLGPCISPSPLGEGRGGGISNEPRPHRWLIERREILGMERCRLGSPCLAQAVVIVEPKARDRARD